MSLAAFILVPAPVLWEIAILDKAGHITLSKPFEQWLRDLLHKPCFDQIPLDTEIIVESRSYSFNNAIFLHCSPAYQTAARKKASPIPDCIVQYLPAEFALVCRTEKPMARL